MPKTQETVRVGEFCGGVEEKREEREDLLLYALGHHDLGLESLVQRHK